jgi:RNA polymerase sigma factor (sigma-70 family)
MHCGRPAGSACRGAQMLFGFFARCCDLLAGWRILGGMSRFLDCQPDADCLRRAVAGDRAAQRLIYDQTAGPLFALIRRIVAGRAAAEDVFQDSMITLLHHLPDYRGDAPFGAWARQIAVRQALMHLRSPWQRARRALQSVLPGAATRTPSDTADMQAVPDALLRGSDPPLAELIDLERALGKLPEMSRAVVWMHDAEGLTHEEIAAAFGRSVSFSKSQLARAHAALRAQLSDDHNQHDRSAPVAGIAAQGHLP